MFALDRADLANRARRPAARSAYLIGWLHNQRGRKDAISTILAQVGKSIEGIVRYQRL